MKQVFFYTFIIYDGTMRFFPLSNVHLYFCKHEVYVVVASEFFFQMNFKIRELNEGDILTTRQMCKFDLLLTFSVTSLFFNTIFQRSHG